MEKAVGNTFHRFSVWLLFLFMVLTIQADDGGVLNRKIKITKSKETIYDFLKHISDQSGYLFIYDSQIVDNDKEVRIRKGEYTLREAIYAVTGNRKIEITVIGNHILLRLPNTTPRVRTEKVPVTQTSDTIQNKYFSIGGTIYDRFTNEPISFAAIGINNTTIGNITNQDGEFKLNIPDSLGSNKIKISHVGYQSEEIEASLLAGQTVKISLEPKIIPLQEIIVRVVDPMQVMEDMIKNRDKNYSSTPVNMTVFYREGVEHKKKNIDITESVLNIYKTGFQKNIKTDQVKLIKMRRIVSRQESDTIFTKIKSGINACLLLDVIKNLPDFMTSATNEYTYTYTDINVVDGRRVNVISFEQDKYLETPLFKGELFIDAENQALVEARFQINPQYAEKATSMFVEKKKKDINLSLQSVQYTVSYKPSVDGVYYINHIRGDLNFKVKRKRRLFSTALHLWFEMVNCEIETKDVKSFSRGERLSPYNIFSETKFKYDKDFWGNLNVILPEEKLKETIINNLNQVIEVNDNSY